MFARGLPGSQGPAAVGEDPAIAPQTPEGPRGEMGCFQNSQPPFPFRSLPSGWITPGHGPRWPLLAEGKENLLARCLGLGIPGPSSRPPCGRPTSQRVRGPQFCGPDRVTSAQSPGPGLAQNRSSRLGETLCQEFRPQKPGMGTGIGTLPQVNLNHQWSPGPLRSLGQTAPISWDGPFCPGCPFLPEKGENPIRQALPRFFWAARTAQTGGAGEGRWAYPPASPRQSSRPATPSAPGDLAPVKAATGQANGLIAQPGIPHGCPGGRLPRPLGGVPGTAKPTAGPPIAPTEPPPANPQVAGQGPNRASPKAPPSTSSRGAYPPASAQRAGRGDGPRAKKPPLERTALIDGHSRQQARSFGVEGR